MKRKSNKGIAAIELTHSGIPDDQLQPEVFDARQLAVLKALHPDQQARIRQGCPVVVVDLETGATVVEFNRKNVKPSKAEIDIFARQLAQSIQEHFKDPENVRKYEEWKRDRDKHDE